MNPNRFAEQWESYLARVVPADAGDVQKQETRAAFYAGGFALWNLILGALEEGAEPTPEDMRMMDQLQSEFNAFRRELEAAARGSS